MTEKKKAAAIRSGDLIRIMWKPSGKMRGLCMGCDWTPVGTTHYNIARECMRHTRKLGGEHVTRFACLEIIEYRPRRTATPPSPDPGTLTAS